MMKEQEVSKQQIQKNLKNENKVVIEIAKKILKKHKEAFEKLAK